MSLQQQIETLENEIREKKETLAKLRDQLEPVEIKDYALLGQGNKEVKLSELFGDKSELILVWNMGKSCPYCTLWADGYNGLNAHLNDRAAFVVVSPDAPEVQAEFAKSRGWKFRMLSHKGSSFARDFDLQDDKYVTPGVSVFLKKDGELFHHTKSIFDPGDNFCSLWDFIDLLPSEVRSVPKYSYNP